MLCCVCTVQVLVLLYRSRGLLVLGCGLRGLWFVVCGLMRSVVVSLFGLSFHPQRKEWYIDLKKMPTVDPRSGRLF